MMGHFESLIVVRIYEIISLISGIFPEVRGEELYRHLDFDRTVIDQRITYKVELVKGYTAVIYEEYQYHNYQLQISYYNYSFTTLDGELLLSYDSSLHYPQLANFPHHRHLYPKDKYPPVGFSGKLSDALAEARWIIEKLP